MKAYIDMETKYLGHCYQYGHHFYNISLSNRVYYLKDSYYYVRMTLGFSPTRYA
jgi:hypothetical protein